jgi:hypothetical protein
MSDRLLTTMVPSNELPASAGGTIPVEVLNHIMGYLPLESRVAYTLTCKHFKILLGTQHFADINSREKKLAFLNVLVRDLPNAIVCSTCTRLHYMENIVRYVHGTYDIHDSKNLAYYHMTYPACLHNDNFLNTKLISKNIGATAFRMAIKRYQQRPECTDLLKALSPSIRPLRPVRAMLRDLYISISTEEFRVVQDHLLQRKQTLYVPRWRPITMMDYVEKPPITQICNHKGIASSWRNVHSWPQKCYYCYTDYRVDFKYNGVGYGMFLTTWRDFGSSPDHDGWKEHLQTRHQRTTAGHQSHERGDICAAFGDAENFQFDSLFTKDDQMYLLEYQRPEEPSPWEN